MSLENNEIRHNELSGSSGTESSDEEEEDFDRYWPIPDTCSAKFNASFNFKTVSALAFNNAGTRFAAGSHDYGVRIWDLASVNPSEPVPLCNIQPSGQTVIKNVDFSQNDEFILVVSGGCQAAVIAKDGIMNKQHQCAKGDQYLTDMANTKGHTQMLNDGCWNPKDKETFITSSNDSTIRIWDLNKMSQQKTVIKVKSPATGLKSVPNVCRFSRDAQSMIAGCNDGSLLVWDTRRKFLTTSANIRNAHSKGSEIVGLDTSYSQTNICSRSEDSTCKTWDLRQFKQPLATRAGLESSYSLSDCSYSPNDKIIMLGTLAGDQNKSGKLLFLDASDLSTKYEIESEGSSVIRSKWHPKINHIGYTTSEGKAIMLYSERGSIGGLVTANERVASGSGTKRKLYVSERHLSSKKIITPHVLPLFREDASVSSFSKIRQNPKLSYKPEVPVTGASQGGQVRPAGSTLSSYIAQNIAKPKDDGGLNIRERLLRHDEEAKKNPIWVKGSFSEPKPQVDDHE